MEINLKPYLSHGVGVFFILAGGYHFANADYYIPLIPDYLPAPLLINLLVGAIELALGALILQRKYRKLGATGSILLLVLLIPSHLFFIQSGSCIQGGLCVYSKSGVW
jgi:uncharacterized membrane protein